MSDARDDRRASFGASPFPEPPSFRPDTDPNAGVDPDDFDSDPRPKWKPNPALLQALADARKDLKPGEASLFWDWTATRDSAPPAEDVHPSGEGEVLVSDKEAAAAYVPPVKVAPAVPARSGTKSRVRVRDDVDPRRQPTMKTARSSSAPGAPVAPFRDAMDSRPSANELGRPSPPPARAPSTPSAPDRQAMVPPSPHMTYRMSGPERRRRVAWAVFFGSVTGVLVFFWLRIPPASAPPTGAPMASPPATDAGSGAARQVAAVPPRAPRSPAIAEGSGATSPSAAPAPSGVARQPAGALSQSAPSQTAPSQTPPLQTAPSQTPPLQTTPAQPPSKTPALPSSSPSSSHDSPSKATDSGSDFLVRPKKD
jgi:hypothetical protein